MRTSQLSRFGRSVSSIPPRPFRARCRASSGRNTSTVTLPIFPLRLVALPSATVPLMIFEPKYRVLFNTLLYGMDGVEEGLVQTDSPFCGTKKFGMVFSDKTGNLASVGTVLEIQDFAHIQKDGRLFVTSKGRERFSITGVVKDKRLPSVLVCEVELMKEDDTQESKAEVKELAREVADLLRATIKLNVKMNNISATDDQLEPEELAELGPRDVSFFVASFFADAQPLQQILLEEDNTMARLQREKDVLQETVQFYSAALAVKTALSSSTTTTTDS